MAIHNGGNFFNRVDLVYLIIWILIRLKKGIRKNIRLIILSLHLLILKNIISL